MPIIYHEGYSLGGSSDANQLLKDTVGWIGKNLLKNTASSQTKNGITFTVNSDGTITANGTATANTSFYLAEINSSKFPTSIIVSSGVANDNAYIFANAMNGSSFVRQLGNTRKSKEFNLNLDYSDYEHVNLEIWIISGQTVNNLTFYPMIRHADILDDTYEPYHESVEEEIEQVYADNGVLGAKNLLENVATNGTSNGITYTVNSDKSISFAGTTTATSNFAITPDIATNKFLDDGNYILSIGTPLPTGTELWLNGYVNGAYYNHVATMTAGMKEVAFTVTPNLTGLKLYIQIPHVSGGRVVSSTTIYPMIRLASDPDDTYQPYTMTNRELTEKVLLKKALSNVDLNDITEYGMYSIQTGITNRPLSVTYATLIVAPGSSFDGAARTQMVYKDQYLYIRSKSGSPATWTNWYKFTGTVVS